MTRKDFAQLCKKRRNELGYTQQQLADILEIDKPRISEIENDHSNLSFDKLLPLLSALKLQISQKNIA